MMEEDADDPAFVSDGSSGEELAKKSKGGISPSKFSRNASSISIKVSAKEDAYRETNYHDVEVVLDEKILCTSCGHNLKPDVETGGPIFYHPHLEVLLCEDCSHDYGKGDFSVDEDGSDKYCRWCGNGGSLYCCSKCVCAFCKKCVRRNFKDTLLKELDNEDWKCFVCNPKPLFKSRGICYAAVKYAKKIMREKKEMRKLKVAEWAKEKMSGVKPNRRDRSARFQRSSESDIEVIESSDSASKASQLNTDKKKSVAPSKESLKTRKKPIHFIKEEAGSLADSDSKGNRRKSTIHKTLTVPAAKNSSEDFSDSDFEPKKSQRLRSSGVSNTLRSKESKNDCSPLEKTPSPINSKAVKNEKKEKELETSDTRKVLVCHADDIACIAARLMDSVAGLNVDQTKDILGSTKYMLTLVQDSVETLLNCAGGLKALKKKIVNCTESSNGYEEPSPLVIPDSDDLDAESNLFVPFCSDNDFDEKNDVTAKRCGSTSSDGGRSLVISRASSKNEMVDEEVAEHEDTGKKARGNVEDAPCAAQSNHNVSVDLFEDSDLEGKESEQLSTNHLDASHSPKEQNKNGDPEASSVSHVAQSSKSLSVKVDLLNSSSSDSDSEHEKQGNVSSFSGCSKSSTRNRSSCDADLEVRIQGQSHRKKSSFNIRNLDIYHSDSKFRGKWSVDIERMDEAKESKYLELVGDYYDSSTDSDKSVDNLTNLNNLKRKAKISEGDSNEDSTKSSAKPKSKKEKHSKKEPEEGTRLQDFFGNTGGDTEQESSFEDRTRNLLQKVEEPISSLNDAQKKALLCSSDSESDTPKVKTEGESLSESDHKKSLTKKMKKEMKDSDTDKTDKVDSEQKPATEKDSDSAANSDDNRKKKKNWRSNRLLRTKLSDTDTSEDEKLWQKRQAKTMGKDSSDDDNVPLKTKRGKSSSQADITAEVDLKSDEDSSTSEDFVKKKRKVFTKKASSSSSSESESAKKKPKKRRRIKVPNSSSDSEEDNDTSKNKESPSKGRRKIRHVIKEDELEEGTKNAAKEEEERRQRIAARQKMYDELYNNIQEGFEVIDKLVLDFDEKTKEPLIEVDKVLVKKLKPHQVKGVKFMWDACFESVKRINSSKGSGAILAHCMGLGKTFQVVTLVHTLLKYPETKVNRVLVVCPVSTVLNWVNEFQKWLSDVSEARNIEVFELTRLKNNVDRKYKLSEWLEDGGVMIIGYDMYRNLSNPDGKKFKTHVMKVFQAALVNPGPDLVICDEGHLLKNEDTATSKALTRVKTSRRIILTGTPLQNNLKEYHCMVQFVKPNLLGTRKEFLNRFVNPITNGQFEDSTSHDVKRMKRRAHVLHKTLEGSVQRFDYSVLTPFLPEKQEYVISVRLTELQEKLYRHYLDNFSSRGAQGKGAQLFADFQQLQRVWTHPRVLKMSADRNELKAVKEEEDSEGSLRDFIDDGDDSDTSSPASSSSKPSSDDDVVCLSDESNTNNKKSKEKPKHGRRTRSNKDISPEPEPLPPTKQAEWWEQFLNENDLEDMKASNKLTLLFSILKDCEENGEKLLVFSQSLFSLDIIEYFLSKIDEATQKGVQDELLNGHQGSWSPGIDYFRLDGQTPAEIRSAWCKTFNRTDNLRARLFLISTRAGGLGINLVAANRVIIFDASWNPSHDVQSIFRVYRFGQKKPCFIYRFLAQGTMEEKIYERQVTKLSLACRVVDELQIERYYKAADLQELYNFSPADRSVHVMPKLPKDHLFAEILKKHEGLITTYHEHDSLLENKEEEELNEEERKAAWEDYENEKKGPVNQTAFDLGEPLPTLDQLQEVIKARHPEWSEDQLKNSATTALRQMQTQRQNQLAQQNLLAQRILQQQMQLPLQQAFQKYLQPSNQPQRMPLLPGLQQGHQMYPQAYQQYQMPNYGRAGSPYGNPSTSSSQLYFPQIRPRANLNAAPAQAYLGPLSSNPSFPR